MQNLMKLFLITFLLVSCQPEGRVFADHQELSPELEWLRKDKREFNIGIEDTAASYDLSLTFRYATGYQFKTLKVKVKEISPSGIEEVKDYEVGIVDEKGDYVGDPGLDIWDSEHLIHSGITFDEKGTYTYVIEHNMPQNQLNFAMEIGLILDKKQ